MSNSKVRIYELSKDLNLDNRDILDICEQLNIQVKSHSSTITEAEAGRIRSIAENYKPASAATPHRISASHTPGTAANLPSKASAHSQSSSSTNRPVVKKQQILEIRRYSNAEVATPPAQSVGVEVEAPANAGLVAMPPTTTPKPISSPPSIPSRPLRPGPNPEGPGMVAPQAAVVLTPPTTESARTPEPPRVEAAVSPLVSPPIVPPDSAPLPTLGTPQEDPAPVPTAASVVPPSSSGAPDLSAPAEEAIEPVQPLGDSPAIPLSPPAAKRSQRTEILNTPPAQPTPISSNRPALVNRPVLKQARTDKPVVPNGPNGAVPSQTPPRPVLPKPSQVQRSETIMERPVSQRDASQRDDGPRERPVGAPQGRVSLPDIRRPQLVPPGGARDGADGVPVRKLNADGTEVRTDKPAGSPELDERPRRPALPTKVGVKHGKQWEEEEDDVQDFPQKAATKATVAATKSKRRNQPFVLDEDEEEELIEEGLNVNGPMIQVTLSLERPAKAKSRPAQPKAAVVTARPKPSAPGEDSSRGRHRRERREEVVVEKPTSITLSGNLTVQELSSLLMVPETDVIKVLFFKGIAANINQTLEVGTATIVAKELGAEVELAEKVSAAQKGEMLDEADLENLKRRPPVVTIMGHVDHGKTTLLDSIRKTKVAQGEAGGITQHIGAYHVDVDYEGKTQQVVFLDTPGHEAFTAMRARGAKVTDIAVLVVAADDGVQPQTIEAISHAKAAGVPIVVAINKIDKEGANADRVKQELTEFSLVSEEWGGDTVMVPVSAIRGDNLDKLLEMILLVAEVADLSANPDRPAKGTVIEANLDKSKGPVASLLIQNGTLRVGDMLVAGSTMGRVRAMVDDRGQRVEVAYPSFAVEILGLDNVPAAGDEFEVFADEREARNLASDRVDQQRVYRLQQQALAARRVTLSSLSASAREGELKELNLILKADVQGSVEAILGALQQIPQNEVQIRILLTAPGEITQTDVDLAAASSAVILGFNTALASGARQAADELGVDVRDYNIIYKLLDDVQGAMEGLLEPEMIEEPLGQVEVRAVFPVGRGSVAGCYVLSGKVVRNCHVRVRRGSEVIHTGLLDSLKRMKEDAKEVNAGYECGIGVSNFSTWQEGDIIEAFRMTTKRRTLSPN